MNGASYKHDYDEKKSGRYKNDSNGISRNNEYKGKGKHSALYETSSV